MKNGFPLSTDWSLSRMENIRSWLSRLAQISQTRELALLSFDIRQVASSISDFDQARVLAEDDSSEEEAPAASIVPLAKPPLPPLIQTTRPTCPIPTLATNKDPVAGVPSAPPPASTIRVKRSTRNKQPSGEVEDVDEVHFPNKVSTYMFCRSFLFLTTLSV